MVELNQKDRTISAKIVYYGPAVGGKTTNIKMLHEHAAASRRGDLVSVNSAQDRTILFDLLPIKATAFRGFDLKVQLVAVPGQAMYAAVRKLTLKNVDALVFVANSAVDRQEENISSFREMISNLVTLHLEPTSLPLVLQYNKRDLPDVVLPQVMDRTLNARQTIAIPAVAVRGEGVLETFSAILTLTAADLARRYRLMDTGRGQTVEEWSATAIQDIFGTTSFGPPLAESTSDAASDGDGPGGRTIRVRVPSHVSGAAKPDSQANEALVESYAEAATALGEITQQVREERDRAQRRLVDMLQVLDTARALKPGVPVEPLLVVVLGCLAQEVDAPRATFLVPAPAVGLRAAALYGLERDPILSQGEMMPLLQSFLEAAVPAWHEAEEHSPLFEVLALTRPPHGGVVSVPLAVPQSAPVSLALLYRAPSAAPPRPESLRHLAALARILASVVPPPVLRAGDGESASRELLGTALQLATPHLLASLGDLRQTIGDLRRRPDVPVWLPPGLAQTAPSLGAAVALARSLASLETGVLEDELLDVVELLAPLAGKNVRIETAADAATAKVNPTLLRLALEALIDRARRQAGPDRVVDVRATVLGGRLALRVGVRGPVAWAPSADQRIDFARKVVELHGGSLNVRIDPEQGSWVILDVAAG